MIARKLGNRSNEAKGLYYLGLASAELGEHDKAATFIRNALEIYERTASPEAEIVRQKLAEWQQFLNEQNDYKLT